MNRHGKMMSLFIMLIMVSSSIVAGMVAAQERGEPEPTFAQEPYEPDETPPEINKVEVARINGDGDKVEISVRAKSGTLAEGDSLRVVVRVRDKGGKGLRASYESSSGLERVQVVWKTGLGTRSTGDDIKDYQNMEHNGSGVYIWQSDNLGRGKYGLQVEAEDRARGGGNIARLWSEEQVIIVERPTNYTGPGDNNDENPPDDETFEGEWTDGLFHKDYFWVVRANRDPQSSTNTKKAKSQKPWDESESYINDLCVEYSRTKSSDIVAKVKYETMKIYFLWLDGSANIFQLADYGTSGWQAVMGTDKGTYFGYYTWARDGTYLTDGGHWEVVASSNVFGANWYYNLRKNGDNYAFGGQGPASDHTEGL